MKKKIGLFGFGTVGKGVYELLSKFSYLPVEIAKVCVKRLDLERVNHPLYFTDDAQELLQDEEIDIIIEVISNAEAAKEIVTQALESGKSVISANKKMIGSSIDLIDQLHEQFDHKLFYEAAVGGGIPIIRNLSDVFRTQRVTKVRGILNGSSNYILTQMERRNLSFEKALEEAQKKGFAEANPSLDVDGFDASYKLRILGYHAFGEVIDLKACNQESIRNVSVADINQAKKKKKKIKPIATLQRSGDRYECSIKPEWIGPTDFLYTVDEENNGISISTEISGDHVLVGKGAGAFPTGSAILTDLKQLLDRNVAFGSTKRSSLLA